MADYNVDRKLWEKPDKFAHAHTHTHSYKKGLVISKWNIIVTKHYRELRFTHVFSLHRAESKPEVAHTSISCILALLTIFSASSSAFEVSGLKIRLGSRASIDLLVSGCEW